VTRVCHLARPAARPHPAARLTPRPGPGDYATTDEQTVADLHAAVGRFFELHPRLAANEFYLSGAPRLARTAAAEAPARAAMLRGGGAPGLSDGGARVQARATRACTCRCSRRRCSRATRRRTRCSRSTSRWGARGRGSPGARGAPARRMRADAAAAGLRPALTAPQLRRQGYMVGNPSTEAANVYDSEPRFALYKALIGRPLYDDLVAACDNVFHNVTPGAAGPRAACASALSPRRPPPAARRAQARPARRCTRRCATSCTRCPTRSGARPRRALGQLRCLGEHAPRPPPARAQGALQVPRPGRRRRPGPRLGRHTAATVTAGGGARRGRAHGAGPRRELGRAGLPRRARVYRPQARPCVPTTGAPRGGRPTGSRPRGGARAGR